MPQYSNAFPPYAIGPGDFVAAWGTLTQGVLGGGETPTPGNGGVSASSQAALVSAGGVGSGVHFHGQFSGAPGAFEVDCQVSDVDVDTEYQTLAGLNVTTVDATNNTFHAEAITNARFARMLMRSRANAVSILATIGR